MRYPMIVAAAFLSFTSTALAQTQTAATYASENVARANCGSYPVVWMNTDSNVFHFHGAKNYGKTKAGAYMCRDVAEKIGHAAKNEKDPSVQTMPAPGSPPKPTSR